ncbi:MAG: hypothetical protein AAB886_02250, partial [Patescibacteria group bacterium]
VRSNVLQKCSEMIEVLQTDPSVTSNATSTEPIKLGGSPEVKMEPSMRDSGKEVAPAVDGALAEMAIENREKEARESILRSVSRRKSFFTNQFRTYPGGSHSSAETQICAGLMHAMPILQPNQKLGDNFIQRCVQDRVFMKKVFDESNLTDSQERLTMMLLFPNEAEISMVAGTKEAVPSVTEVSADAMEKHNKDVAGNDASNMSSPMPRTEPVVERTEEGIVTEPAMKALDASEEVVDNEPMVMFPEVARWLLENQDTSVRGMMDKFKISEEHAKGILGEMQDSGVVDRSVPRKVAIKDEEALRKALTRYRNSTVGRPVDTVSVPVEVNSEGTPIVPIKREEGGVAGMAVLAGGLAAAGGVALASREGAGGGAVVENRARTAAEAPDFTSAAEITRQSYGGGGGGGGGEVDKKTVGGGKLAELPKDAAWLKKHWNVQAPKKVWAERWIRGVSRWAANTIDIIAPRALVNGIKGIENWGIGWLNQLPFVNIGKKKMEEDLVLPDVVKKNK